MLRMLPVVIISLLLTAVFVDAQAAALPSFSHYQVILDRKPFGDLENPALSNAEAGKAEKEAQQIIMQEQQEQQKLARQVDLVAIVINPRGKLSVGLVDKSNRSPQSIFLGKGESEAGYTILDIDNKNEMVVVEKEGTIITLKLGKGLVETKREEREGRVVLSAQETFGEAEVLNEFPSSEPMLANGETVTQPGGEKVPLGIRKQIRGSGRPGYREQRRHNRSLEEAKKKEETQKLVQEAVKVALEEKEEKDDQKRKEAIESYKRGESDSIPFELTPEEDAELVRSGYLDPRPM